MGTRNGWFPSRRGDALPRSSWDRRQGYGIAVMTDSDSGEQIIDEIAARAAGAANWDSLDKPVPR